MAEREPKGLENWRAIAARLIWAAAVVFLGAGFLRQWALMTAGLAALGIVLTIRATLSFLIVRRWRKSGVSFANSFGATGYFAVVQLIIAIAAMIGAAGEAVNGYLSSGRIGRDIARFSVIEIGVGLVFLTAGGFMLSGALVFENKRLKTVSKESVLMLVQGIGYSIVGLLLIAAFGYEMISRLLRQ